MVFDFQAVAAPFRMQPGLRRLDGGAPQLTPNAPGSRALREKLAVLQTWPYEALLAVPGFDAAPALDALCAHAAAEHPYALGWEGGETIDARGLGWQLRDGRILGGGPPDIGQVLESLPPEWRRAALLCLAFAEDFAVVDGVTACIPWLAVCLPSHWAPDEKLGRHFNEVHAPVADNALLLAAGERLARLVTGPERWERFVWTVTPESRLQAHPRHAGSVAWPDGDDPNALVAQAFFRSERQTFIPLPSARQAVFTIRVDVQPLADAVDTPGKARQLHDALASMSDAVLAYRRLAPARERLLRWLVDRGAR